MTPRLTASYDWMLRGMSAQEAFPIIKAMGFSVVEYCFPYDRTAKEMRALLDEHGLDMSLMITPGPPPPDGWGIASTPGKEEEFALSFAAGVDYAQRVGCPVIGTMAGALPEGAERSVYEEVLISNLAKAAKVARRAGVTITLEPVATERSPNFLLHTMEEGARIVEAAGDEALGLCFDTLHAAFEMGSPIRSARQYGHLVNYLQIGNPPDRLGPGLGDLDIPRFLEEAIPASKAPWVGCEYIVQDWSDPKATMAWASPLLDADKLAW